MNCTTPEATMVRMIDLLEDRGYDANYEYPGYVDILVHQDRNLSIAFGDVNDTWNGQLMNVDGFTEDSEIDIDTYISTNCLDAERIVKALCPIIDKVKESLK